MTYRQPSGASGSQEGSAKAALTGLRLLSPSKTLEGLAGGVASATLLGTALCWITPFNPWQSALVSLASAVAAVRHVVAGLLSIALPASVPVGELSAVTLQPARGSGAGVVTATGTARGITCAACGSPAVGSVLPWMTTVPGAGENWRVYADPAGKPFCFTWPARPSSGAWACACSRP